MRYDFTKLIQECVALKPYVYINDYEDASIDFANYAAVKMLNRALLKSFYNINNWDIPEGYLCPPVPGRADYIHNMADLLASLNNGIIPKGKLVNVIDIGVGANCIYPLIAQFEYGWNFVGSDIDPVAIGSAQKIIAANEQLHDAIQLRLQKNPSSIFKGIWNTDDKFDLSICNPPFHASLAEAQAGTQRKLKNLGYNQTKKPMLNFGGKQMELSCKGGESGFVRQMIKESSAMPLACLWYSTLVSKKENLPAIYQALKMVKAFAVKTIPMAQGQKMSRIVAWSFLNEKEQNEWKKKWKK